MAAGMISEVWLTRRGFVALAGVGLLGGCSSEAGRINRLFFGAVKRDPLYSWRPDWVTEVSDFETPLGGIYPEATARLRRSLSADVLPTSAMDDAVAFALSSGWAARDDESGVVRYVKNIANSDLAMHLFVSRFVGDTGSWLTMEFLAMNA